LGASLVFVHVCGALGLTRVERAVSSADSLCVKGTQAHMMSATLRCLGLAHSLKIICKFHHFDGIFAF
jgi:hypothetical protein